MCFLNATPEFNDRSESFFKTETTDDGHNAGMWRLDKIGSVQIELKVLNK